MHTAIAKVRFWSDDGEINQENVVLTNMPNYAKAMELIEAYYGSDLQSCNIRLLDAPFLYAVPDEEIDRIIKQV